MNIVDWSRNGETKVLLCIPGHHAHLFDSNRYSKSPTLSLKVGFFELKYTVL